MKMPLLQLSQCLYDYLAYVSGCEREGLTMLLLLLIDLCRGLCPRLPMRKGRLIRGTGRPVCVLVRQLN